jgi:DNA-binding transcriptional MocR family regulator
MEKFDGFDFGRLHPDTRIFPVSQFKKSLNKIILERGESILDYGSSMGYLPLREHIARRMQRHSIPVKPEEILISSGAQNAIDLLLKLFIKPNAKVLVEAPTYGMIIPALQFYGFEIISIPMKRSGVDLFYLEEKLKNEKYSFFYTMPNFQNPTGITTSQSHREKLLALCEKFSVPIIEDAYEEEMKYFGKVSMPIKSMDSKQIVIYVGSFSKILFPGIRLGWVAADKECIARLVNLKRFGDISSAMPEQAALANFCMNGEYELHIKKLHKIYRARMSLAIKTLKTITKSFKNIVWQEPNGGFTIWIELKKIKKSYEEIDTILKSFRIRVALGQDFYVEPVREIYLRLAIASLDDVEIVNGLKQLEKAISKIYSK